MIITARECLSPGLSAVVVYTDGHNCNLFAPDGEAYTSWWKLSARKNPDKVIVYLVDADESKREVYIADFVDKVRRPDEDKQRFKLYLKRVLRLGETDSLWWEFTESKRNSANPVAYVGESAKQRR